MTNNRAFKAIQAIKDEPNKTTEAELLKHCLKVLATETTKTQSL